MTLLSLRAVLAAGLAVALLASQAAAQTAAANPAPAAKATKAKRGSGTPFAGFGGNSKEPIKIDANKLEVYDKENRAVYSGDVVSVQGQSTLRCSVMTIFYTGGAGRNNKGEQPAAEPAKAQGAAGNSIRKIECSGPVSLVSGTMSATSKFMVYDAQAETATFTGSVVILDCENVQRGERAVYDVKSGRATVDAGAKGRVQGVFTPGGDDKKKSPGECPAKRG
jgi:lipopolysaccharide export system protein LptA